MTNLIYSNDFIKRLKSRVDLLQLVSNYTEMKRTGDGQYMGKCPHPDHHDDTPSFIVYNKNVNDQNWSCYGCHNGGKNLQDGASKNYGSDCFAFIQWISNYHGSSKPMSFADAVKVLAEYVGMPLEEDRFLGKYKELKALAQRQQVDLFARPDLISYLNGRGLSDDDIAYFGIGFDIEENRISFPLPNADGNIVGFSRRRVSDDIDVPKYKNSETSEWFQKKMYLYGMHSVDKSFKYAFITEGVFDVALGQKYGLKNVFGLLNSSLTEPHARFISNMGLTPVFCQDNDEAGQKGILKAVNLMAEYGVNSKVCLLPTGKDLAETALICKENLSQFLLDRSEYFGYYYLRKMFEQFDKDMYDLRMTYLPGAMDLIGKVPSTSEQELLKYELYKKMGGKSFSDML